MAYTTVDDSSTSFQAKAYVGNGTDGHSITNTGNSNMKPDWVWIKYRDGGVSHVNYDSSRGATKRLYNDFASTEATQAAGVKSFDTDGFTLGDAGASNQNNINFVAWQWRANEGSTSSNTSGTITSTVQTNTSAGISILTYTGTGSSATIGHGLGAKPAWIVIKSRTTSANWTVRHKKTTNNYDFISMNDNAVPTANDSVWTQTEPTTSVFSIGTATAVNQNNIGYICYCFAEVQGFSRFGKYFGSGASDGTFVYCGFRPAYVMIRNISEATNWEIFDVARNPGNVCDKKLGANLGASENGSDLGNTSQNNIDIVSNGFKCRTGNTDTNTAGGEFIFMAFAEFPFVSSTKKATTAR
tara:strand:+ start:1402 stop:2469 length:1068 start_codon:yes stop_codon:yes gene_type:complete